MSRAEVLDRLKNSAQPLSGQILAKSLGVTRAAIHKHIQNLRQAGHGIEGSPRVGYRWASPPEGVSLHRGSGLGYPFLYLETLPSTQEELKQRASQGAPEGLLVCAETQTSGRGRLGRQWFSPPGGLWCSLLLRPDLQPERLPALSLVAALSLTRVLRRLYDIPAQVKWPNDVWLEGEKIAGILLESALEIDRVHWVAVGLGVNVNNPPPAGTVVPATSLKAWLGRGVDRSALLAAWLADFEKDYRRYLSMNFKPFVVEFNRLSLFSQKNITWEEAGQRFSGRALGVDPLGRLRVRGPAREHRLVGGEVQQVRSSVR